VGPDQISQVRGYADQKLRDPSNPLDPSNRRVSLIVQWVDAAGTQVGAKATTPPGGANQGVSEEDTKPQASNGNPQPGIGDKPDRPNSAAAGESKPDTAHPVAAATAKPPLAKSIDSKPAWTERLKTMVAAAKKKA
jgi:chemotaxis protein MotB